MKNIGFIKGMLTDAGGGWSSMRGMGWVLLFTTVGYIITCLYQRIEIQESILLVLLGFAFGGKLIQKPMEEKNQI